MGTIEEEVSWKWTQEELFLIDRYFSLIDNTLKLTVIRERLERCQSDEAYKHLWPNIGDALVDMKKLVLREKKEAFEIVGVINMKNHYMKEEREAQEESLLIDL